MVQIPTYQMAQDIDFITPLSRLGQAFETNAQRSRLSELGRGLADGTINYRQAAGMAADMGDINSSMKFLAMDEDDKKLKRQQAASEQFSTTIRGMYGGGGQPSITGPLSAPMTPSSGPQPAANRIYSNDESSPLDPPSGRDRDLAVRTVIAESGNQSPTGQNAVASVIRNRAVAGGVSPSAVVTAPNQFEPWNTQEGRARMAAIDPNSPPYQAAHAALTRAYAGEDPTNGAMNFYAPKAQAALGRPAPSWDNGRGVDIGDHRFFGGAPNGQPAPYQVAQAGGGVAGPPAQGAPTPEAPQQPSAATAQSPSMRQVPLLLQAISNPNLPANEKDIAKMFLNRALDDAKPSDKVKTLNELKNASGFQGTILDLEKELRAASKPQVTVDQRSESEETKAAAKAAGERRGSMIAAAGVASKSLVNISRMEGLLNQVSQGKLDPAKMTVSAWAKALGVNDEFATSIGLDPKGVGSAQALQALVNESVLGKIGPGGLPANNFSNKDLQFLVDIFPKLGDDPASNKIKIEGARRVAQLDIERAKDYRDWKNRPENKAKGFEDFEVEWADQIAKRDLFGDLRAEAERIAGPPRPDAPRTLSNPGTAPTGDGWTPVPGMNGVTIRQR